MKHWIAFIPPFLGALAVNIGQHKPESLNDWVVAVVLSAGVGVTGNGAMAVNTVVKSRRKK